MWILLTVILAFLAPEVEGLMCYICTDVESPGDCNNVGECPPYQKCHIKRYATTLGVVSYDLGCQPDSFCSGVGKRDEMSRRQADVVMWNRCCDSDFCNVDFIKNGTTMIQPGIRCFKCDNARDPADCTNVIQCEKGDVCATFEELSVRGHISYKLTCEAKKVCDREGYFLPTSRRNVKRRDLCRGCCDGESHCNRQFCSEHFNRTSVHLIGTSPAPTTTPRPRIAIIHGPKNQKVEQGKSVVLDCRVSADPDPVITWEHLHYGVDTPVTHHIVTTQTGTRIVIPEVHVKDAGTYICIVSNAAGAISATATLEVGQSPHIGTRPFTKVVKIGDSVKIPCQAKGDPQPQINWDFHSASNDHLYPIGIEVTSDNSLVISKVTAEHLGVWSCVAHNEYGQMTVNVTLQSS